MKLWFIPVWNEPNFPGSSRTIMILLANVALEALFFLFQIIFELLGGLIWGIFEALFAKSDVVLGFFVIGLLIAIGLFCWMSNPWHAAGWSAAEIAALIILGFAVDSAKT